MDFNKRENKLGSALLRYFSDLTNYSYLHYENSKNIGWLGSTEDYRRGKVSKEFMNKLLEYLPEGLMQIRGYGGCDLCMVPKQECLVATHNGKSIKLGFAEIRVLSEDGVAAYASPDLIYHYIIKHEYRPPEEFIRAVLNGPKPKSIAYEKFLLSFNDYTLQGHSKNKIQIKVWGKKIESVKVAKEICEAIKNDCVDKLETLIKTNICENNIIVPFSKWLYFAAAEGKLNIVKCMLSCGIEADLSSPSTNPLFGAIRCGNVEIVRLLIENGIDTNIKYNNEFMKNMDALDLAYKKNDRKIVQGFQ